MNRNPITMVKPPLMVEAKHVKIMPLTYLQLISYLKANNEFENEWELATTGRTVAEDVRGMVENFTLPKMKKASEDNYLYLTFWIVIDKSANTIVAELGFKGPPDRKGEIEIGYGTMPDQQRKGYMTEAVSAMIRWASTRDGVKAVLAEVEETNLASIRIVQKNAFLQFDKRGKMLWWRRLLNREEDES